jgi:hypothetical protein
MERMKEILLTPIPLPSFGRPAARGSGRRAALRRRSSAPAAVSTQTFHLSGPLERGTNTKYAISGQDFVIDENTWIFGEFRLGAVAAVKGERQGEQHYAKKVSIA